MESQDNKVNSTVLLIISVAASFFNPLMGAAVNIALPKISAEFNMNAIAMSWIAMAFLLASAIALVPFGKIADLYGRKKIFLIGNIVVAIASLLCAVSSTGTFLIISRALQGIGSAMVFGTTMAIVTSAFPPHKRGRIIGINVTAVYLGLSIAPLLGGYLTQSIGWRSIFYLMVLVALMTAVLMYIFVKGDWKSPNKENFDFKGSIIYAFAITGLIYGFSKLPDINAIIIALIGVVGLIIFIKTELKLTNPVMNINLFRDNRTFAYSNLAAMINYAATFAIAFVLSLFLQYVKGFSPRSAGMILITQPIVMALFASVSGRLSDRFDPRVLASIGMSVVVIGLAFLVFLSSGTSLLYIIISLVIVGIGFGIFSSPNTNAIMSSVENSYLGIASATVATMRTTGQMFSMGIAALIIHTYIGEAKIVQQNLHLFVHSIQIIFIVFTVLCAFGVLASLAGRKKNIVNV
ncbi:MAG: MFS transporter [bacterium]